MTRQNMIPDQTSSAPRMWCDRCSARREVDEVHTETSLDRRGETTFLVHTLTCGHDIAYVTGRDPSPVVPPYRAAGITTQHDPYDGRI